MIMVILILMNGLAGFAQVTIEECQRRAQEHYPLVRQYVQIEEAEAYRLANAGKGYLPQMRLSGSASYRSDVTRLPIDVSQWGIPGIDIPTLSKDQYGLSFDMVQMLWDGGEIKSGKERVRTAAQVEKEHVGVGLYALYKQVNRVFFGILLADAGLQQNKLLQEELAQLSTRTGLCTAWHSRRNRPPCRACGATESETARYGAYLRSHGLYRHLGESDRNGYK